MVHLALTQTLQTPRNETFLCKRRQTIPCTIAGQPCARPWF